MSQAISPFKLGLFILFGMTLAVGGLMVLGVNSFWTEKRLMETYLDESVQGLEIGSTVKYRGVMVGKVCDIGFTHYRYELDKPMAKRKPYVIVEIELMENAFGGGTEEDLHRVLLPEIERGLRIRLSSQNLTGTAYLEMDYVEPNGLGQLDKDWEPQSVYIPSATSTISRFLSAAEAVFKRLEEVDVEGISLQINQVLANVNEKMEQIDLKGLADAYIAFGRELRESNRALKDLLDKDSLKAIPDEVLGVVEGFHQQIVESGLRKALDRLPGTLEGVDRVVMGNTQRIEEVMESLVGISRDLKDLTENAKKFPSQLLLGEPPPVASPWKKP